MATKKLVAKKKTKAVKKRSTKDKLSIPDPRKDATPLLTLPDWSKRDHTIATALNAVKAGEFVYALDLKRYDPPPDTRSVWRRFGDFVIGFLGRVWDR